MYLIVKNGKEIVHKSSNKTKVEEMFATLKLLQYDDGDIFALVREGASTNTTIDSFVYCLPETKKVRFCKAAIQNLRHVIDYCDNEHGQRFFKFVNPQAIRVFSNLCTLTENYVEYMGRKAVVEALWTKLVVKYPMEDYNFEDVKKEFQDHYNKMDQEFQIHHNRSRSTNVIENAMVEVFNDGFKQQLYELRDLVASFDVFEREISSGDDASKKDSEK